jgi:hypothetical protein
LFYQFAREFSGIIRKHVFTAQIIARQRRNPISEYLSQRRKGAKERIVISNEERNLS